MNKERAKKMANDDLEKAIKELRDEVAKIKEKQEKDKPWRNAQARVMKQLVERSGIDRNEDTELVSVEEE